MDTLQSARLDRALCSAGWRSRFDNAFVTHAAKLNSDHVPIVVNIVGLSTPHPPYFKNQIAWLTYDGFENVIKRNWNSLAPI